MDQARSTNRTVTIRLRLQATKPKDEYMWLTYQGIVFKPSAYYSQEENGVSEKTGRTIMEMVQAMILEGRMEDTLWPEVILVITHVKNLRPTRALKEFISPIEK